MIKYYLATSDKWPMELLSEYSCYFLQSQIKLYFFKGEDFDLVFP